MDSYLEQELLKFFNTVENSETLIEYFRQEEQSLFGSELAQQILVLRANLPQQRFDSLSEIKDIPGLTRELFGKIVELFPIKQGWRLNTHPMLLMPVRLETRFMNDALYVRIYPDQIYVDAHEAKLTQTELDIGKRYQHQVNSVASDAPNFEGNRRDAWRELVRMVGVERAAWINKLFYRTSDSESLSILENPVDTPGAQPRLKALPDRFEVFAYQKDKLVSHISGNPIYGEFPLLANLTTDSEDYFDSQSRWMVDFEEAEQRGMAIKINQSDLPIDHRLSDGFTKIVVIGVRSASVESNQELLKELFESHHYSDGMAFLKYGTPTNNTELTQSGHSESLSGNVENSYQTEVLGTAHWHQPLLKVRTNAHCLENALGIGGESDCFRYLENGGESEESYAQEMQTVLWTVTGDYFLRSLLPGVVDELGLKKLSQHFKQFVRASGPLPAIRVGEQPYGILPVTSVRAKSESHSTGWESSSADNVNEEDSSTFDTALHAVLTKLHSKWISWAKDPRRVPRINSIENTDFKLSADEELVKVLAMEPVSIAYKTRPYVSSAFIRWLIFTMMDYVFDELVDFVPPEFRNSSQGEAEKSAEHQKENTAQTFLANRWSQLWEEQRDAFSQQWSELTGVSLEKIRNAPIQKLLSWWKDSDLELGLVNFESNDKQELPDDYLNELCHSGRSDTQTPNTLLHDLLKRSLLLAQDSSFTLKQVRESICRLIEPVLLNYFNTVSEAGDIVQTLKDDTTFVDDISAAQSISESVAQQILVERDKLPNKRFISIKQIDEVPGVAEDTLHHILLSIPSGRPNIDLERLLRQTLDLCTYRLDAWITSLATKRLTAMRDVNPSGICLGAYGWIEDLKPNVEAKLSDGYIHTPSQRQAEAAAVVHNAYLTHEYNDDDNNKVNPFRVNLSSERVRRALSILEGIRQGQPLGALLGYQFERCLHERRLDKYIDDFRDAFPLVANKQNVSDSHESHVALAARNVVDGLALARWRENPERIDVANSSTQSRNKIAELLSVNNELNTEVRGIQNSLDSVSDLMTFESVYQTAQGNYERAGAALDVLSGNGYPPEVESVLIPVSGKNLSHRVCVILPNAKKKMHTPRGKAEPRIAAWFKELLGNLGEIAAQFNFTPERININSASYNELMDLPGVDKKTIKRVINYRQRYGEFKTIDEIDNIWKLQDDELEDDHEDDKEKRDARSLKGKIITTSSKDDKEKYEIKTTILKRWVKTGVDSSEATYYQPINLNTATEQDISQLKHIKSEAVGKIISARPIVCLDELQKLDIDRKTINSIRPWVITGLVTLKQLSLDAIDLLYISAALPHSSDTLNLLEETYLDDPLVLDSRRININNASLEALVNLPGISKGDAKKIYKGIQRNGPLKSLDELVNFWKENDEKGGDHKDEDKDKKRSEKSKEDRDGKSRHSVVDLLHRWVTTGNHMHEKQFYQRININLDPIEELCLLPGINQGIAQRIIAQRPINNIEELLGIEGLNQATLDSIRPWTSLATIQKQRFSIHSSALTTEDTEIERRIKYFVRNDYWLHSDISIDTNIWAKSTFTHSLGESIQLAQSIFKMLTGGTLLRPDVFQLPSSAEKTGYTQDDVNELKHRVDITLKNVCKLIVSLGGAPLIGSDGNPICSHFQRKHDYNENYADDDKHDDDEKHEKWNLMDTLSRTGLYGVQGSFPEGPYDENVNDKRQTALHEMNKRAHTAINLLKGVNEGAETNNSITTYVECLKLLLGREFIVLPTFTPENQNQLNTIFSQDSDSSSIQHDKLDIWCQQAAKTHPGLAKIDEAIMTSGLWRQSTGKAATPALNLRIAQLPGSDAGLLALSDDDRETAIHDDFNANRGFVSIVAAVGNGKSNSTSNDKLCVAGLLMDQWDELIPFESINTGLSFHYDAPNNQAPQCLLLAVPGQIPANPSPWQVSELLEIVNDTIDLSKIRAVDTDAMSEPNEEADTENDSKIEGVGFMLPALMLPVDISHATISDNDSFAEWIKPIEIPRQACMSGQLIYPSINTEVNGKTEEWNFYIDSEFPLRKYAPGLDAQELSLSTVRLIGAATRVTNQFLVKDYEVIHYPQGFMPVSLEGTVSLKSSGENEQLELLVDDHVFELQGGSVLEMRNVLNAKFSVTGHAPENADNRRIWVDDYQIIDVDGGGPVSAIGILTGHDDGNVLIDAENNQWFLDGEIDVDRVREHLGNKIWVIGEKGHREVAAPVDDTSDAQEGETLPQKGAPNIMVTQIGTLREERDMVSCK